MSDEQSTSSTAKDAVESAAEQVRAAAPGVYDASAKAGRYVEEVASEHPLPLLLAAAALACIAGYVSHTRSRDDRGSWRNQGRDWQKRGYELAESARASAPQVSQAATDVGQYVAHNAREHPISGLLIAGAVGWMVASLLRTRG